MPASAALLLCIVFVLLLLLIEHRQTPKVSRALWVPASWMLYAASRPLSMWFGGVGGEDRDAGSPLDQYFLITILCLGVLILVSRRFVWSRAVRDNAWLWLLLGYMLVSVLWSDILFISFKRWTRELIAVVMAVVVLTDRDPRQAMQSLFRRVIYILIPFSFILIKYFPEYGRAYGRWSGAEMWVGVTTQKNTLGRLCLIAAFFLIWTLVRRSHGRDVAPSKYQTYADMSILIPTLFLLSGPGGQYSATALTSLAGGLAALVGLLWMKKHKIILGANTWVVIMALIIGLGTIQPFMGGSSLKDFTPTLGRDMTLTGRTDIWAGLIPDVMRSPILGSGFGGFWIPTTREAHQVGEAHNGYLDVVLETGFVGLLFTAIFLLSSCRQAQKVMAYDFDWGSLWMCFLLMTLLHNISESSINSFTGSLTSIVLFLTICGAAAAGPTVEGRAMSRKERYLVA
jgi:exopolysaccharide production protein ExoQ